MTAIRIASRIRAALGEALRADGGPGGREYTVQELQEGVNRVFRTGLFSSCEPVTTPHRDGTVALDVEVTPNPQLRGVRVDGADAMPAK